MDITIEYKAIYACAPFSTNSKIYPAGMYSFEENRFAATLLHVDGLQPLSITDWNKDKSFSTDTEKDTL